MFYDFNFIRQTLALFPVFVNTFMYGCASSWVSNAMIFLTKTDHKPFVPLEKYGILAQLFEAGRLIFAIPGGILVDKFGRKKIILTVGIMNILCWTIVAFSPSITFIYAARFVLGIASALLYVSALTIIGEIACPRYRGTLTGVNEIANMSGQLFESIITIVFNSYEILTYATMVAASFFVPASSWSVESPYYLVYKSRHERAKVTLAVLQPDVVGVDEKRLNHELERIRDAIEIEKSRKSDLTWFNFLKVKSIRAAFRCALPLNILSVCCGGPVMSLYITAILPENRYFSNTFYPFISFAVQFASAFGSTFVVDKFARRTLYIGGAIASVSMQTINAIVCILFTRRGRDGDGDDDWTKWCLIFNCFAYMIIDRGLISPLNSTVRSEIFPLCVKGMGNALCVICQAVTLIICYQLYGIVDKNYDRWVNFAVFAFFSCLLALVVYFVLPETRGKSLAEVQLSMEAAATATMAGAASKSISISVVDVANLSPPSLKI